MRFLTHLCLVEDTSDLIHTYAEVRRYRHPRKLGQWSVIITRDFKCVARVDVNCVTQVRDSLKKHFGGRACLRVVNEKVSQRQIRSQRVAFRLK